MTRTATTILLLSVFAGVTLGLGACVAEVELLPESADYPLQRDDPRARLDPSLEAVPGEPSLVEADESVVGGTVGRASHLVVHDLASGASVWKDDLFDVPEG